MKNWWLMSTCVAISLSVPAMAQPVPSERPALSASAQKQQRAKFAWLLGTWQADHMFGSNSNRSGARVTFFLESDGTVSARLDKMSEWMEMDEKKFREVLGKTFIRGIRTSGRSRATWTHSAHEGMVFDKNSGNWTNLGIIYVSRKDGKLSSLGAMSDFAHWVKVSGPQANSAPQTGGTTNNVPERNQRATNIPSSAANGASDTRASDTRSSTPKVDEKRLRCIHQPTYATMLNTSTGRVIKNFTDATETVARYDPGLPRTRLYPSPIESSADIPEFLEAADYLVLDELEVITKEMVTNRGPDNWLKEKRNRIRQLHGLARDKYDGAAKRAADAFKPCPTYSEPVPYALLTEADKIMTELRQRRDNDLKPLLEKGEQLNEALTRKLYEELAAANSLENKAGSWLGKKISDTLQKERIEPRKIEALMPQLDALRDVYQRLEAAGTPVSDKQRDIDLVAALKKSGIDYSPTNGEKIVRELAVELGDEAFNAIGALMIQARAPDILKLGSRALGYVSLAKDTAEIINGLKNVVALWDIRQELMPVTLAVSEDRAYLIGLIDRYDRVEAEYEKLQKLFENSVSASGDIANREW